MYSLAPLHYFSIKEKRVPLLPANFSNILMVQSSMYLLAHVAKVCRETQDAPDQGHCSVIKMIKYQE